MDHLLLTLALGPILLLQGAYARRKTPKLPEPPGARRGTTGSGPRLRLLVLGDSSAAGVGAAHQEGALVGRVVEALSATHSVEWTLHARTGATTEETLASLAELDGAEFDIAVTALGVNDVITWVTRPAWRSRQARLRTVLRESFGVTSIVASGLPPMEGFPALPQPLRWYLGRRAGRFDRDLEEDVRDEPDVTFLSLGFGRDASGMATDGFHPGPPLYAEWGKRVAEAIRAAWEGRLDEAMG